MKIKVYVQPGAKKSGYVGLHGGYPKIKISSPPLEGEANKELINFMAYILNISKTNINIISGSTSRLKTLEIKTDITENYLLEKLTQSI